MMSQFMEKIMTAIKGVRGAGDAIRGEVMDATDRVFDNKFNHKETEAAQTKNRALAAKGREEMKDADELFGRHDFDPKDSTDSTASVPAATTTTTAAAPTATAPTVPPRAPVDVPVEKGGVN